MGQTSQHRCRWSATLHIVGPGGLLDGTQQRPKVVEIRIHGVGGEPASHLLNDPHPNLIAGDDISGFYRPGEPADLDVPERERQALSWGGNTSGSWKNALWILLLPFSLVNVAGYMHRPGVLPSKLMRWLALTITLGVVVLSAATAYDLIAMQCGGTPTCVGRVRLLAPFLWKFNDHDVFIGFPTRRLGLATLVPLGQLTLLWFAGKYAYKDLESYLNRRLHTAGSADSYRLTDRGFWNGYEPAFRTRLIHLIAGRAVIAGLLAWSIYNLDRTRAGAPLAVMGATAALVFAGTVGAIVLRKVHRAEPSAGLKKNLARLQILSWAVLGATLGLSAAFVPWSREGSAMRALAVGLGIVVAVKLVFPLKLPGFLLHVAPFLAGLFAGIVSFPAIVIAEPQLGGQRTFYAGLFGAPYDFAWAIGFIQTILIAAIALRPTRPAPRPDQGMPFGPHWTPKDRAPHAFNGRGSAVMATLAVFITLAVGAGVHRGVANMVADPVDNTEPAVLLNSEEGVGAAVLENEEQQDLSQAVIPWWYETTAHVLVFLILGLLVAGFRATRGLRKQPTREQLEEVKRHLQSDPVFDNAIDLDSTEHRPRLVSVFKNWAVARELVRADSRLLLTTWLAALFGLILLLIQAPEWTPGFGWRPDSDFFGKPFGALSTFSLKVVGMLPVVAVLALRAAAQKESWRRQIGRLWDVLMFWPRSIQPFAPPCYAERVVPQLRLHIDRLNREGKHVVVAGHSQGSVIAAAAVATGPLPDPEAEDKGIELGDPGMLDLVVYGSPISILYERTYPAYFGTDFFAGVEKKAGTWHHFFARSDIFCYPFWNSPPADVTVPCPVCGYFVSAVQPVVPTQRRTDYVVVDPVFWDWQTEEPPPPQTMGHSSYATDKHPRFEEHLQTIAIRAYEKQSAAGP